MRDTNDTWANVLQCHWEAIATLGILILVELSGLCLLISAIEWLRHLSGRNGPRSLEVRYFLPILTPVAFVLLLSYDLQKPLPTTATNVGILVGVSVGFAAVILWLLAEVPRYRRYRARSQHAYRPAGPRSRMRKAR